MDLLGVPGDQPEQQLTAEQRERQLRRQRYLNIIRARMPTFDDNFMSRSESQIQNQLYRRSLGLPPRAMRAGFLGTYQSLNNLPTLNEVNE